MWKHYLAGIVPGLVVNIILALSWMSSFMREEYLLLFFFTFFTLPVGLLAGFVGHMIARVKSKQPPQSFRDVKTSFVLGILFLVAFFFIYLSTGFLGGFL